ncbi:hypothetical protein [Paludibacter jiangxiensis]|uniref:Uncharacterized protein n=1 Tax=Paludibacter jiangxiensis TaxID=681398 RepID=A0A161L8N6_9BACT|nr:hypothetical protein [Paludibacter jiangxiensis]GAT63554.1 hypothetical protein PJIAN_493 [Paludibacter jiangxiensis]
MRASVKNIAGTFIILLIALQVVNLSVDSVDFYTQTNSHSAMDDQDYTDSMLEFVVENMLGFSKHTLHDKANNNSTSKMQQNSMHWDVKLFYTTTPKSAVKELADNRLSYFITNDKAVTLYYSEVSPKPPQCIFA